MKLMLVIGTRPEIVQSAPLVHKLSKDNGIKFQFVHTGQHYDFEMYKVFFDEFDLPDPTVNLGVGSGSHAWQTGEMMIKLEKVMEKSKPNVVLIPGDTNSTLAGALAAVKLQLPVAHFEAGARSYDLTMPEEVNRRLTDHASSFLFAPSANCRNNLVKEGIEKKSIHLTGDTMYDSFLQHMPEAVRNNILEELSLEPPYSILTLHRPENVDDPDNLRGILEAIISLRNLKTIFPVHPRTKRRLQLTGLDMLLEGKDYIKLVDPLSYHEMLKLLSQAELVLTDSGGIQKQSFWLHKPCITLRRNTEWIETVKLGFNHVVGTKKEDIVRVYKRILRDRVSTSKPGRVSNPFGNGKASDNIIRILKNSQC